MLHRALAIRYSKALLELARQSGQPLEVQHKELIKVTGYLKNSPALRRAVESPTVPAPVKKSILRHLLGKRVDQTTLHFLYVLVDKSREVYVDAILHGYSELLRQERGQIEVVVHTAAPISNELLAEVRKILLDYTGKAVELKTEIEPDLLGGMVIRIGDRVIDGSIRHQLTQIQERLTKVKVATVGG